MNLQDSAFQVCIRIVLLGHPGGSIDDQMHETKGKVNKMQRGGRMVKVTRMKQGQFAKWDLLISHIVRKSLAFNYFVKIPTPIIMAATGHRSESSFLKYIGKSRAEMASMLAEYWYGSMKK